MPPQNDNFTKCFHHMDKDHMNWVKMELKLRRRLAKLNKSLSCIG